MKRREFITLLGGRGGGVAVCGARAAAGDAGRPDSSIAICLTRVEIVCAPSARA